MKRFAIVLTALAFMVGTSWADFIVIRINLNGPTEMPATEESSSGSGGAGSPSMPSVPGRGGGRGGGAGPSMPSPPSAGGGGGGGAPAMLGGPGTGSGSGTAPTSEGKTPAWFIAVVDVNVAQRTVGKETQYVITHPWGRVQTTKPDELITDVMNLQWVKQDMFATQLNKLMAEKKFTEPMRVLDWMLRRWNFPGNGRLLDADIRVRFEEFLDELNREQGKLQAADRAKMQTLLATRDAIKTPLTPPTDEINRLKTYPNLGDNYRVLSKNHFAILHVPNQDKLADRIHNRLEQTFAGFYYWHAMQGKMLPLPRQQLICILAESEPKFDALHQMFDNLPLTTDGFFSSLDNVSVFSAVRRDEAFKNFRTHVSDVEKQLKEKDLDFDKLLRGDALNKKQQELRAEFISYARAAAVAAQAAREEGEVSTIMHETVQQLMAATGMLPRHVLIPRAIRDGLASFYASPRSQGEINLPALWTGIGGEHWQYLPVFRRLMDAEKGGKFSWPSHFGETRFDVGKISIPRIITDQNFLAAEQASSSEKLFYQTRAKAEAWALMYFLSHKKYDQLQKFMAELSQLPRDMELSTDILEQAFARAFDLHADPSKPEIAAPKLDMLEKEFREFMQYQILPFDTTAAR